MNDYQPKVGDRVMVSEHGPYEVLSVNERDRTAVLLHVVDGRAATRAGTATWSWLTPAPEPEPDEPTAPGALVRDGEGRLFSRSRERGDAYPWACLDAGDDADVAVWEIWRDLTRPITVILADPAEVETLRAERDAYRKAKQENDERFQLEAAAQRHRADELQRRIDRALNELACVGGTVHRAVTILRGES